MLNYKHIEDMVTSFRLNNNMRLTCIISENIVGNRGVRFDVFKNIHDSLIQLSTCENHTVENKGYVNMIDCFYKDLMRHRYIVGKKMEITKREPIVQVDTTCSKRTGVRLQYQLIKNTVYDETNKDISDPLFVRLQQVWSFCYKGIFLFKLKKIVEAKTKHEACKNAPQFWISVTILPNTTYIQAHGDNYITKSYISKAMCLIGQDSTVSTLQVLEVDLPENIDIERKKSF